MPLIFFVPSCGGQFFKVAYNSADAAKNDSLDNQISIATVESSKDSLVTNDTIINRQEPIVIPPTPPIDTLDANDDRWETFKKKLIMPTKSSLSAIGVVIIFEYDSGRALIATSFILSLSLLLIGNRPWDCGIREVDFDTARSGDWGTQGIWYG